MITYELMMVGHVFERINTHIPIIRKFLYFNHRTVFDDSYLINVLRVLIRGHSFGHSFRYPNMFQLYRKYVFECTYIRHQIEQKNLPSKPSLIIHLNTR